MEEQITDHIYRRGNGFFVCRLMAAFFGVFNIKEGNYSILFIVSTDQF